MPLIHSLATHLAIIDSDLNLNQKFTHILAITPSCTLDAIR